jgi:putative aminopeptidase FrvX
MKKMLFVWLTLVFFTIQAVPKEFQFLSELTNAHGPSGFEDNVRALLVNAWQPYLTHLKTDPMGNLTGELKGSNQNRVLLMAHMDEVGFMVSHIEDNGLVRIQMLGGLDDNVLAAQRYKILTAKGAVNAYSGIESVHIIPKNKRDKLIKKESLFLDIGASSKAEAIKMGVHPGLAVSPASEFTSLTKTRFLAKALDDRIGLSVLTDVMKGLKDNKNNVFFAATVQEEVGLRGADVIYNQTKPDIAINLEIGIASDFPLHFGVRSSEIRLGKGPTLFVYDASLIPNQAMLHWVEKVAKSAHIAFQYEVEPGYGEDAAKIQTKGHGVPVINIGVPVRYAHQQAGVFDANDYREAVKLVKALIQHYNQNSLS